MKISFEGAAKTVTGSQTWVQHQGYHFLVDCGLYQGPKEQRLLNWEKPAYYEKIQAMIITHAHIDHSGLIPRWVQWGWTGPIYCTQATADLLSVMLIDSARLQEEDARFANKTKYSHHDPALPLYNEEDARKALKLLYPLPFDKWVNLSPALSFQFTRAGHILGSAFVQISYAVNDHSKLLTFSGDLGNHNSDLIKDPQSTLETDVLVLESTYGNRKVNSQGREDRFAEIVNKVINRQGTLVIPAFALGRAQDLLFTLHQLKKQNRIPNVPIYLDSPMANEVTEIYLKNQDELRLAPHNQDIEEALSNRFFRPVGDADESMLLCMSTEPKIVISASGMLQGGRVLHHLKMKLPDEKSGVLFVGFQGSETKGRLLQEGIGSLRIHHQEITVEAEIFTLEGYSAHADDEDIQNWLKAYHKKPSQVFLNHGEPTAQTTLAERIKSELGLNVTIPSLHEGFDI